jgi:hypothetical protein
MTFAVFNTFSTDSMFSSALPALLILSNPLVPMKKLAIVATSFTLFSVTNYFPAA